MLTAFYWLIFLYFHSTPSAQAARNFRPPVARNPALEAVQGNRARVSVELTGIPQSHIPAITAFARDNTALSAVGARQELATADGIPSPASQARAGVIPVAISPELSRRQGTSDRKEAEVRGSLQTLHGRIQRNRSASPQIQTGENFTTDNTLYQYFHGGGNRSPLVDVLEIGASAANPPMPTRLWVRSAARPSNMHNDSRPILVDLCESPLHASPNPPFSVNEFSEKIAQVATMILTHYVDPMEPSQILEAAFNAIGVQTLDKRLFMDLNAGLKVLLKLWDETLLRLSEHISKYKKSKPHLRRYLKENLAAIRWTVQGNLHAAAYLLLRNFVNPPLTKSLLKTSLQGMMAILQDPYSQLLFLNPQAQLDYRKEVWGSYIGTGIRLKQTQGGLTILAIWPDSPAHQAGLKPEDEIIQINGEDTRSLFLNQAMAKIIDGKKGQQVALTVRRRDSHTGNVLEFPVTLTMTVLELPHIFVSSFHEIAYLYVTAFNKIALKQSLAALRSIQDKSRALILDLRYNPGGDSGAMRELLAQFLKKGQMMYAHESRGRRKLFRAKEDGEFSNWPMAVLVNGDSASASEVLAASLQDQGRATILGEPTYGKGSAQSVWFAGNLFDESIILMLADARWYTPLGRFLKHGENSQGGLIPDIPVPVHAELGQRLLGQITAQIVYQTFGIPPTQDTLSDPVLERAIELLTPP